MIPPVGKTISFGQLECYIIRSYHVLMTQHPGQPWCRYADDGLVHCKTEQEAQGILVGLKGRFAACGLELHPEKTKIIYCKDGKRRKHYPTTKFTFLGYDFRSRSSLNSKTKEIFGNFSPAVSDMAAKSMRMHIRRSGIRNRSDLSLQEIAAQYNSILRGWINYYGCYYRTRLNSVMLHFNKVLTAWAMHKYRKLRGHKTKASLFIIKVQKENPQLFSHWKCGLGIGFA
jgi:RNA-directed DNA polymerase